MEETVLLGTNGFGPGAMKAVRSLMEASITAEYIRPLLVATRVALEWAHIEKYKSWSFYASTCLRLTRNSKMRGTCKPQL